MYADDEFKAKFENDIQEYESKRSRRARSGIAQNDPTVRISDTEPDDSE